MGVTIRFFVILLTHVFLFAPLHAQAGAFAVDDSAVGAPGEVSLDLVSDRGRTGLQAGIRQTVHQGRIDLDLAVGRNLSDERATCLVFGVTGRF